MANLDFTADLKLGELGAKKLIELLSSKGHKHLSSNYDNAFDEEFLVFGKKTKYEVKTDFIASPPPFDTGNIFIEFESRGKLSGISVTKAKWFVTYLIHLDELWFIESTKLLKLISENNFYVAYNSGDLGSKTHGYLIKRKDFKKYFNVVKV